MRQIYWKSFSNYCILFNYCNERWAEITSRVIILWPIPAVYVSSSRHIVDKGPQIKQKSIFNIFGIGSHAAVKTGHWSQHWHCVYCKHTLRKHPLSSASVKVLRHCQWQETVLCLKCYILHMPGHWNSFVSPQSFCYSEFFVSLVFMLLHRY